MINFWVSLLPHHMWTWPDNPPTPNSSPSSPSVFSSSSTNAKNHVRSHPQDSLYLSSKVMDNTLTTNFLDSTKLSLKFVDSCFWTVVNFEIRWKLWIRGWVTKIYWFTFLVIRKLCRLAGSSWLVVGVNQICWYHLLDIGTHCVFARNSHLN